MAYTPLSKTVIQYVDSNGDPYSGAVLKAYEAGTSTVLSMATDSTGGTLVTSIALNSDGFPEVSGNIVIPHLNANFQLALYPTQTAADVNTGAIWNPDNIAFGLTSTTFAFDAGEGIDFSAQTPAAGVTSQLFDNYEEGTWTPVLSDGTNNATSSTAVGKYTKIGRAAHITCRLGTSSLGSVSGNLRITGLPFTSSSDANSHASMTVAFGEGLGITAGFVVCAFINPGVDYIVLNLWDATSGTTDLQESEWTANGGIILSGTYFV